MQKHAFVVESCEAIAANSIALNNLQRESLNLNEGDTIGIEVWTIPTDPAFGLHSLRLELEVYDQGLNKWSFKEIDLLPEVKLAYAGQVLFKGQKFWGKFGSKTLMYTVRSMEAPTHGKDMKSMFSFFHICSHFLSLVAHKAKDTLRKQ